MSNHVIRDKCSQEESFTINPNDNHSFHHHESDHKETADAHLQDKPKGERLDKPKHNHNHSHVMTKNSDARWFALALVLLSSFIVVELLTGYWAHSLALMSDAGHMFVDALAIALALYVARLVTKPAPANYTYGYARVEIISGVINGLTLVIMAVFIVQSAIRHLVKPQMTQGKLVIYISIIGIIVNIIVMWAVGKGNKDSLNTRAALTHILNDLYGFIATLISGICTAFFHWNRVDALASLLIAGLMFKHGYAIIKEGTLILLDVAPGYIPVKEILDYMNSVDHVVDVHSLHIWEISNQLPAISAHIVVEDEADLLKVRQTITDTLIEHYSFTITSIQIEVESARKVS